MVCKEGLPFNLVESPSFRAFVEELDPKYKLPTRKALSTTLIPERHEIIQTKIREDMSKGKAKAVTTDMWTSSNNDSYMGVTCHWVDEDYQLRNTCLAIKHAPGSHTADLISTELSEIMTDWGIERPVHLVTDSGANVKRAMSLMEGVEWRPCFAHTLQLVVNGGLGSREVTELPKVLAKARAIVGHFRRSPLATVQLEKAQTQLSLPQHRLKQDCPTRWNSQVRHIIEHNEIFYQKFIS